MTHNRTHNFGYSITLSRLRQGVSGLFARNISLYKLKKSDIINGYSQWENKTYGRLAQLGERCVRIAEVESSNLLSSTSSKASKMLALLFYFYCQNCICSGLPCSLRFALQIQRLKFLKRYTELYVDFMITPHTNGFYKLGHDHFLGLKDAVIVCFGQPISWSYSRRTWLPPAQPDNTTFRADYRAM